MEEKKYEELIQNLTCLHKEFNLRETNIFLFGYCEATLILVDTLLNENLMVSAILDNSKEKQGIVYKGVRVIAPQNIMEDSSSTRDEKSVVLLASRFAESMQSQLRDLGYKGSIRKIVDYNTFADYSLSEITINRKKKRIEEGIDKLEKLIQKYSDHFIVFCPFNALGDIYLMASYFPSFAEKIGVSKVVYCVLNESLLNVIHMFGDENVEVFNQHELEAMIQAALFTNNKKTYIAHQDRPYVINLHKALYEKKINFENIYCCGVYGLPEDTIPRKPLVNRKVYKDIDSIQFKKSVIFAPYAKSITPIDSRVWEKAVSYYVNAGYKCFTNIIGNEKPLDRTEPISPSLLEIGSVVERAGTFIGIRSGLCDVIREVQAKKIALYPDYNYCDTKWKAMDIYRINQFDYNLLATEEIKWETL